MERYMIWSKGAPHQLTCTLSYALRHGRRLAQSIGEPVVIRSWPGHGPVATCYPGGDTAYGPGRIGRALHWMGQALRVRSPWQGT